MVSPDVEAKANEYETLIRRIKDVVSTRVMLAPSGAIEEIHVLATGGRSPKHLVRDVESALMSQGVSVDHKKISVALLAPENGGAPDDRTRLVGFSLSQTGRAVEARVRLEYKGTAVEGAGHGPSVGAGRLRAVADATVQALQQLIKGGTVLFLDECGIVRVGTSQAATVCLLEVDGDSERPLVGSCLLRRDELESMVRATLDAVNRRLPVWQTTASE
jgi:hypothetical protein